MKIKVEEYLRLKNIFAWMVQLPTKHGLTTLIRKLPPKLLQLNCVWSLEIHPTWNGLMALVNTSSTGGQATAFTLPRMATHLSFCLVAALSAGNRKILIEQRLYSRNTRCEKKPSLLPVKLKNRRGKITWH